MNPGLPDHGHGPRLRPWQWRPLDFPTLSSEFLGSRNAVAGVPLTRLVTLGVPAYDRLRLHKSLRVACLEPYIGQFFTCTLAASLLKISSRFKLRDPRTLRPGSRSDRPRPELPLRSESYCKTRAKARPAGPPNPVSAAAL